MEILRHDPPLPSVPVLAHTALELKRHEWEEAGFCGYLRKPALLRVLLNEIERCIGEGVTGSRAPRGGSCPQVRATVRCRSSPPYRLYLFLVCTMHDLTRPAAPRGYVIFSPERDAYLEVFDTRAAMTLSWDPAPTSARVFATAEEAEAAALSLLTCLGHAAPCVQVRAAVRSG